MGLGASGGPSHTKIVVRGPSSGNQGIVKSRWGLGRAVQRTYYFRNALLKFLCNEKLPHYFIVDIYTSCSVKQ